MSNWKTLADSELQAVLDRTGADKSIPADQLPAFFAAYFRHKSPQQFAAMKQGPNRYTKPAPPAPKPQAMALAAAPRRKRESDFIQLPAEYIEALVSGTIAELPGPGVERRLIEAYHQRRANRRAG